MLFNNTNMRTAMAYTNAVGDKVYPIIVDIKKGIKSTEEVSFVSSDINTGVLSVAFIQGNDTYTVEGAEVICSVMRPDTTTLEIPCNIINGNTVEVPLGVNGTSQDGVYSFDFKVFKGGNKIVGTPIMNYSVSLSISNDLVVEEDDRLPVLTMLMTQVNELKEETRETINQANAATVASREATANAIEATNNANAVSERVSQETATAISEIKQDTENAIASMNQSTSSAISTMTQKTDEVVTMVNDNLANVNNVVTAKVAELDTAKSDMTNTVSNKVNEVETRFNALTSSQQQDAEVIDARDGETSLKARLDRDIEKANKELDRVKKLEESTVSTIETESDFTIVEATSNGYFEDVKLEGKTLVNCIKLNVDWFDTETTLETSSTTSVGLSSYNKSFDLSLLKNNTTYTIIPFVDYTVVTQGEFYIQLNTDINGVSNSLFRIYENMFNKPTLITTKELTNKNSKSLFIGGANCSYKVRSVKILILEGDHTQNPPSYFEGLKSVGQSASEDEADEIVVSSVKGDGNLVEYIEVNGVIVANGKDYTDNRYVRTNYITVEPNQTYYIKRSTNVLYKDCAVYFYDSNKSYLGYKSGLTSEFTTVANTKFIRLDMKKADNTGNTPEDIDNCDFVVSKCIVSEYIPYQADKKRLLFYNEETQTWEKPILREWDSIEKHANGRYYYHVRSGEYIIKGNESLNLGTEKTNTYFINIPLISLSPKLSSIVICDKFINGEAYGNDNDVECIDIHSNGNLHFNINKNKLSEVSINGVKQWLQANPVTVVYQLAEEKVYECTNIDLITYANETNYVVECGAIAPKSILKVHNNISNVVRTLQEKVSLLENKFIQGLKQVLAGDMYSLAELLYPEDFIEENLENNIMLIPSE